MKPDYCVNEKVKTCLECNLIKENLKQSKRYQRRNPGNVSGFLDCHGVITYTIGNFTKSMNLSERDVRKMFNKFDAKLDEDEENIGESIPLKALADWVNEINTMSGNPRRVDPYTGKIYLVNN
ncbi:MAG: hypothetical protein GYA60_06325 [Candidatus Methanofastidiosa archaeon]|jgi:hypothetical protein|nr:hypothetical protein [Candidatus Methanofastidiosa archaeon]